MPRPHLDLPMSIDEFHVMKHRLGWKHEYWDGVARLSPQSTAIIDYELPIPSDASPTAELDKELALRCIRPEDNVKLIDLFVRAFDDSIEFTGCDEEYYRRNATDSIQTFFGQTEKSRYHRRKGFLEHSFVVSIDDLILGAILIRIEQQRPIVEPVMIDPTVLQQGLGTVLLQATVQSLNRAGESLLLSRCHLGNQASLSWHKRVGFREVVNQFSANHRLRHYEWLARHYDHLQESTQATQMQQLANHWGAIVDDLQSRSINP